MLKAFGPRVIAQLIKEEPKTASGIILPEEKIKDLTHWKARVTDSNDEKVKIGMVILVGKYSGSTLIEDYISVPIADILAIIE